MPKTKVYADGVYLLKVSRGWRLILWKGGRTKRQSHVRNAANILSLAREWVKDCDGDNPLPLYFVE